MLHLGNIVILILFGVYNLFTEGFGETIGEEIDIFVTQSNRMKFQQINCSLYTGFIMLV
jgi:hypothetical protein